MDLVHKLLSTQFEASDDEGAKSFVATISTDSVDRDNEVVLPEGMNSKDFEKNPVVLWNHNPETPIAKAVGLRRKSDRLTAKAVLASRPEDHEGEWFPDTVHSLMKQGVVRGVSIGFLPLPGKTRSATKKDRDTFGSEVKRVHAQWKLMEFSVTPTPANQDALIESVSKGLITKACAMSVFGVEIPEPQPSPTRYYFL
jgi:HK97 family phage prohead protease